MKAVLCTAYGPPEVLSLQEVPKPTPKSREILIQIKATAVNSGDVRVRGLVVDGLKRILMKLVLGFRKPRKPILGLVYSGVVSAIGKDVKRFRIGDEVFGMTGFQFGCYAEYVCVQETSVICMKPKAASHKEAVSMIFGGTTALYFLQKGKIGNQPKKILIYGAAGSVGLASVQIAKYFGSEITAVTSGAGISLLKELAIRHTIDYSKGEFSSLEGKYDLILDAVGKISYKEIAHLLEGKGIFLTVDGWDTARETIDSLEFLKKLFEEGKYKATIDKVFRFEDITEAHRYVDTGKKKGDVVIEIGV